MTIFGKILLGLILVTGAVLIIKGGPKDDGLTEERVAENEAVTTEEQAPIVESQFKGSTAELIARGGDYKCTFDQVVENSRSTGTVYISNGKMRGDFKSDVSAAGTNMSVESHMISDGEYMYTWSSMMPTGMKLKIDQTITTSSETFGQQGSFDANMQLSYDCDPWSPDSSQFTLPSAITFTEIKI